MKKKTTFHNLFQKIVSEEEMAVIQDAIDYKDSARKLDVLTLINYLLCAAMNELKIYRGCADVGDQYGLPKVNFSTLSKKAGQVDYNIMKKLFHLNETILQHIRYAAVENEKLAKVFINF